MLNGEILNDHFDLVETVFEQAQNQRKVRNGKMLNGEILNDHFDIVETVFEQAQNQRKVRNGKIFPIYLSGHLRPKSSSFFHKFDLKHPPTGGPFNTKFRGSSNGLNYL